MGIRDQFRIPVLRAREEGGQAMVEPVDPDLGRRLLLAAHVDGARGVIAYEDRRQAGRAAVLGDNALNQIFGLPSIEVSGTHSFVTNRFQAPFSDSDRTVFSVDASQFRMGVRATLSGGFGNITQVSQRVQANGALQQSCLIRA